METLRGRHWSKAPSGAPRCARTPQRTDTPLCFTRAHTHTHKRGGGGAPRGTEAKRLLLFLSDQSAKVEPNSSAEQPMNTNGAS